MIHHVSTIHTFSNRGLPSTRGAFAINFEKSWKGDVESFPCDIEGASQNLPLSRCPAAVEAARLDGWGLFPTSKIQALETLAQDGDYMISRTAVRILGQSAHLYIPILKKIIQVLLRFVLFCFVLFCFVLFCFVFISFVLLFSFDRPSPSLPFSIPTSKFKLTLST